MRRFALVVCASGVLCSCALARAQAQPAAAGRQRSTPVQAGAPLPVRRVVLYKSGIGYFEHLGRVRNDQSIAIDFNSAQLDDVLKSLTAIDLGNGRVTGISYNSDAPLARRRGGVQWPAGERPTMAGLLTALRGARLEVRGGASAVTGRLLGGERRDGGADQKGVIRDQLTLVTDHGEIRIVELTPSVVVRLAEPASSERVGSYLSLLASTRAPDRRRLTIDTRGTGDRDLLVSYISEVPIWKTNYRIVLAENDRSLLQGWAIVDNTTADDWTNVDLSLVAGAPQSFIQQLSQPLYGRRPVVQTPQALVRTPQTHEGTLIAGAGSIRGAVRDASGAALPGVTV